MVKRRFSGCSASDKITTCGYKVLTFVKYTIIMIVELAVTNSLGSFFD
jgi:hypothetical protein